MKNPLRTSDSKTLPLTVSNTGFLLDRLGQDCHPLQFLRELTQNAIEAIHRTPEKTGEIIWDVDWTSYELEQPGVFKLSISSLRQQSLTGNYGVGAKIAAATRNHAGLIYLSWKDGQGSMIHLWRDPETGQYGLRQIARPDGTFGHYGPLEDTVRPETIIKHGTKIVLSGNAESEDTMKAPEAAASPSRWIAKYLNSRYFTIPADVTIRAREGWEYPRTDQDRNLLRRITGQAEYLQEHARASGAVQLTNAIAHWWILRDEPALSQNSGFIESLGHAAALYQNELYELASGRSGTAKLQQFGVLFGHRAVVIYVEPQAGDSLRITTNTARTQLLVNSLPLPWTEWAAEFRENMPPEIEALMEEVAAGAKTNDQGDSIRDRLKDILSLYRVSRFRPDPTGEVLIDEGRRTRGGEPQVRETVPRPRGPSRPAGAPGGTAGGVYSVFLKKDGTPGKTVRPDVFPKRFWVSIKDRTRDPGDMEDRAARFWVEQNTLLINADFRVFVDMIDHWVIEYEDKPGVREVVEKSVRDWFEQALVETVIGVQALKDSKEWSVEEIDKALSEEALTATVMSRYHVNNSVKRELGTKLGKLQVA